MPTVGLLSDLLSRGASPWQAKALEIMRSARDDVKTAIKGITSFAAAARKVHDMDSDASAAMLEEISGEGNVELMGRQAMEWLAAPARTSDAAYAFAPQDDHLLACVEQLTRDWVATVGDVWVGKQRSLKRQRDEDTEPAAHIAVQVAVPPQALLVPLAAEAGQ